MSGTILHGCLRRCWIAVLVSRTLLTGFLHRPGSVSESNKNWPVADKQSPVWPAIYKIEGQTWSYVSRYYLNLCKSCINHRVIFHRESSRVPQLGIWCSISESLKFPPCYILGDLSYISIRQHPSRNLKSLGKAILSYPPNMSWRPFDNPWD